MAIAADAFLACCFKHCKEKPVVDFQNVATELGMSGGGAKNKYRDILKKLENPVEASTQPATIAATPKKSAAKAAPTKTVGIKRKAATKKEEIPSLSDADDNVEVNFEADKDDAAFELEEAPKKKAKINKAAAAESRKGPTSAPESAANFYTEPEKTAAKANNATPAKKGSAARKPAAPRGKAKGEKTAAAKKGVTEDVTEDSSADDKGKAPKGPEKKPAQAKPATAAAAKGKSKGGRAAIAAAAKKSVEPEAEDNAQDKAAGRDHSSGSEAEATLAPPKAKDKDKTSRRTTPAADGAGAGRKRGRTPAVEVRVIVPPSPAPASKKDEKDEPMAEHSGDVAESVEVTADEKDQDED